MGAAVTWGTTGATMALMRRHSPIGPVAVGFLRVAVAAPILLALAGLTRSFGRGRAPLRPHLPRLALAGGAQAAYQLGYFGAVPRIGVAATALLAICTSPLLIAALAAGFLRERITARVALAMGAGIAGTALLVGGRFTPVGTSPGSALVGAALALGAALAYAIYVVVAKAVVAHVPPFAITGLSFGLAAIALLVPAVLAEPNLWAAARPVWVPVAYLGLLPTALAYSVYILARIIREDANKPPSGLRLRPAIAGLRSGPALSRPPERPVETCRCGGGRTCRRIIRDRSPIANNAGWGCVIPRPPRRALRRCWNPSRPPSSASPSSASPWGGPARSAPPSSWPRSPSSVSGTAGDPSSGSTARPTPVPLASSPIHLPTAQKQSPRRRTAPPRAFRSR